jgi:hypothetical protein
LPAVPQVARTQLGPPVHRPATQTPSPGQAPHSSAPPGQPLPILPQYWPPVGVQVTDGVQAAAPPASLAFAVVSGVDDGNIACPQPAAAAIAAPSKHLICEVIRTVVSPPSGVAGAVVAAEAQAAG